MKSKENKSHLEHKIRELKLAINMDKKARDSVDIQCRKILNQVQNEDHQAEKKQ